MKKFLSTLLALLMLVSLTASAEEAFPTVYVSISDDTGALVLAYAPVFLIDKDGDGALTIADALQAAHDLHCPGGFALAQTEFGLSMTKLWNAENGGSYVNIYYGEDVTEEDAMKVQEQVQAMMPDAEVLCLSGGQPVYHYIFSVE